MKEFFKKIKNWDNRNKGLAIIIYIINYIFANVNWRFF